MSTFLVVIPCALLAFSLPAIGKEGSVVLPAGVIKGTLNEAQRPTQKANS